MRNCVVVDFCVPCVARARLWNQDASVKLLIGTQSAQTLKRLESLSAAVVAGFKPANPTKDGFLVDRKSRVKQGNHGKASYSSFRYNTQHRN